MDADIFVSGKKKLRIKKYPDTCGQGLSWLGCHAGGREFDSDRTDTQGLKITEEKVLPL